MKVLLLKDVPKVGLKNTIVEINQGYANNMLIPKGLAKVANTQDINKIEKQNKQIEDSKNKKQDQIRKDVNSIDGASFNIGRKTNEQGHLFAKINKKEIIDFINQEKNIEINPNWVVEISDDPIKEVGKHDLTIKYDGSKAKINIEVKSN